MIKLTGQNPAPGENLIPTNTDIEFVILDDGTGIDISSLIVYFSGYEVINGNNFSDQFGVSISPNGSDYIVNINPNNALSLGNVYEVKIQIKNNLGKYFNFTYSFKTIPAHPILTKSAPANKDILKFAQLIYLEFEDIIDGVDPNTVFITINDLTYIEDGIPDPNYNGGFSSVIADGDKVIVQIDPIEPLRNGTYTLKYKVADAVAPINQSYLSGSFEFYVEKKQEVLPLIFPQIEFLGFFQGIKRVKNLGDGKSLLIEWNKPIKRSYQNDSFVLVYENPTRLNVFDRPSYIAVTESLEATVTNYQTGVTLSFGARAVEFPVGILDPNGMELVTDGFYKIPQDITIVESLSATGLSLKVNSVIGYPDAGILLVNKEAIRYNSIDRVSNTFFIPVNGRGLLNSVPVIHPVGEPLRLFLECTDKNTVILMSTPTYHDDQTMDRYVKGEGVVVTDYTDNDKQVFEKFDYCGWRDSRPQDTIYGKDDCGTYLGGEFNGFRGFNVYDRMLGQEEMLIEATGEPVILLKRIWDGITCSCLNSRKVSPKVKSCQSCYGTGYEGGYIQFEYPRRMDGRILISFKEAQEDLQYGEKEGLAQNFDPGAWTLAQPTIKDRDLIVRFDFTNDIEFIYEVLNVSRSKNFKRKFGRQEMSLKRLDKTDIVYTYNLDLTNLNKPS